ncbi:MAG: carboxypeptidase-like regulatory domain-containing protein [Gemmatimonadales bacterium]
MRVVRLVLTIVVALSLASPTKAQTIKGKVLNALNGQPLGDVSLVLLDKNGAIKRGYLTDVDGVYELACPKAGTYTLRVGGAGFPTWDSAPMKIDKDQTVDFTVRLVAENAETGLEGFEQRRKEGKGVFLTEEDIRGRGGQRFTDVLINVKAVKVIDFDPDSVDAKGFAEGQHFIPTGGRSNADDPTIRSSRRHSTVRIVGSHSGSESAGFRQGREPSAQCPPVLFVDGKWWGPIDKVGRYGPDYELLPNDMVGIEIYTRQTVPQRFDSGRDALCGVIVVWTKGSKK